jgi:hypothetical protein
VTGGTVYQCPGKTAKDCLVDFADKTAVANMIKEPIAVTYKEGSDPRIVRFEVIVDPACDNGGSQSKFDVMVKGTISVGGTTYYTTSSDSTTYLSTDQSKYSEVGVSMSTCMMNWYLPSPVPVGGQVDENGTASGSVTVSLFVTVKDAAWANPASINDNPPCVSKANGAGSFVCASMAVPYPYVGTANPTVESYKITEASNGNLAVVHLAMSGSEALGAFTRPYFDGTAMGSSSCKAGSWLKSLAKNSDGSFKFTIDMGNNQTFDLFDAFKMANHSGTCRQQDGATYAYVATKM